VCMRRFVFVCMYVCVGICVCLRHFVFVCMYVCVGMCVCMYVYVCVGMCVHASLCVCALHDTCKGNPLTLDCLFPKKEGQALSLPEDVAHTQRFPYYIYVHTLP